jgi:4-amino-4-deoxy-L-arabinose transferase-like glycosyltransferase
LTFRLRRVDHNNPSSSTVAEEISPGSSWTLPIQQPVQGDGVTRLTWLVLGFIALVYIGTCFAPVIFDDNEGLYAGAVREMHQSGNWLMPTVNGFPRVQKPPLVYWTMLVSTSVLGESEFALRLPNALATIGWIFATYLIARRLGGERFGLASAMILATMLGVWVFNHLVQPEPFLACFISLADWCLVEARLSARPTPASLRIVAHRFPGDGWYLLFWVFLALGALSKGLHGALWPLGTVLLAAIFVPTMRPWLRPVFSFRGIVVFFALLAPWYIYMALQLPGFLAAHFINEQLGASLNIRYPADARQLPLLQFYGQHLLFWMPWTLLLPGAIWGAWKVSRPAHAGAWTDAEIDTVRLVFCFAALVLGSVAFSTRQDYYSMVCWGVLAAFLVFSWTARQMAGLRVPRWFLAGPFLFLALVGLASLALAVLWHAPVADSTLAAPIAQRDTLMDALSGISPALWGRLIVLLAIFGAAMGVGGVAATFLAWRGRHFAALLVMAVVMAVPVMLATRGFVVMSPYFSLADSAQAINLELATQPGAIVACEGAPNTGSSLLYYLNARVHWVNAPFDSQYAQNVLGLGRGYYWDQGALESAWRAAQPVYLIVEDDRLAYWRAQLAPAPHLLHHGGTRDVLGNR